MLGSGIMSADKLKLNSKEINRLPEFFLFQTSETFENCLSANGKTPYVRLSNNVGG